MKLSANRHAQHEQCQRTCAALRRKQVADPAGGGRSARSFAHRDSEPRSQQHGIVDGPRRSAGERAPKRDAASEQFFSAASIGEASQWQADDSVEQCEDGGDPAELRVREMKFATDRFRQRAGNMAIVEINDVD